MRDVLRWLFEEATEWLTRQGLPSASPLCDFNRLGFELRTGDVILVEGRSRVSEVIKIITQSPWSHSALYVGRLYDISDPDLREVIGYHYDGDPEDQLIIEALMGRGTIVSSLAAYRDDHLRICRPTGLSPIDAEAVVAYAARHLGWDYDVRQILDLARFFFPWSFLPRRSRSSLFEHNAGKPTRTVCSTLMAEAFMSVDFPILPFIDREEDGSVRFFKRNPRLAAPRDFDYSPYFSIIKYPYLGINDVGLYHRLPWTDDDVYNDERHAFRPTPAKVQTTPALQAEVPAPPPDEPDLAQPALGATGPDGVEDAPPAAAVRRHHAFAFLRRKG